MSSKLFTPWSLGSLNLTNRIVVPPMCMYMCKDGKMGPFHAMHVGSLATSGAGLVILEAAGVVPEGRITPNCVGLWDDDCAASYKAILDGVRTYAPDVPITIQLNHAGRKGSAYAPAAQERDGKSGRVPPSEGGWEPVGPSAIAHGAQHQPPRELTTAEVQQIVQDFVAATRRADALGLEGVELHFAHGYLVHQFLSPLSNQRTDQYGGSEENRERLALELYEACRAVLSPSKPLWVRVSATDWMEGGWDVTRTINLCHKLKALGCPAIHVSSGGLVEEQKIPIGPGYQVRLARQVREATGLPTIAVGMITDPLQAELVLQEGSADAIAVARGLLFNPHWPYEAARVLDGKVAAPPSYWRGTLFPYRSIYKK